MSDSDPSQPLHYRRQRCTRASSGDLEHAIPKIVWGIACVAFGFLLMAFAAVLVMALIHPGEIEESLVRMLAVVLSVALTAGGSWLVWVGVTIWGTPVR